jgi:hypothetical protein
MAQDLPTEIVAVDPDSKGGERRRHRAWLLDLRGWMLLGMGLAGILTVALIVTVDTPFGGIDRLRAVRALVLEDPDSHPDIRRIPFLGGIVSAINDVAPVFFGSVPPGLVAAPPEPSSRPAASPSISAQPLATRAPVGRPPVAATPPPASTTAPTAAPSPSTPNVPASGPGGTPIPSATPLPALAISTDRGANAIVDLADLVPGDSMARTITVKNGGSLAFRYTVSATQTASTPLWTDTTDGLQLTVRTSGGSVLYSGPLSGLGSLAGPTVLAPGASETLRYTFDFPASASDAFQGLVQDLSLVFTAVEFP